MTRLVCFSVSLVLISSLNTNCFIIFGSKMLIRVIIPAIPYPTAVMVVASLMPRKSNSCWVQTVTKSRMVNRTTRMKPAAVYAAKDLKTRWHHLFAPPGRFVKSRAGSPNGILVVR